MMDLQHKIDEALRHEPDYSRIDNLSRDVWRKIRMAEDTSRGAIHIPVFLKAGTLALCVLAILAVSQMSFKAEAEKADMFDLRYFSYQADPSLTFASVNTYRLK